MIMSTVSKLLERLLCSAAIFASKEALNNALYNEIAYLRDYLAASLEVDTTEVQS